MIRVYRGSFFEADIDLASSCESTGSSAYDFKEITRDFLKTEAIFEEKERRKRFSILFDEGHRCYGFFHKDKVVFYSWVTAFLHKEAFVRWIGSSVLVVKPDIAYIWNCFTDPQHRRKGLYKLGLKSITSIYFKEGVNKAYIYCNSENIASRSGIISAGFREIFKFFAVRIIFTYFIKKENGPLKIVKNGQSYDIINS